MQRILISKQASLRKKKKPFIFPYEVAQRTLQTSLTFKKTAAKDAPPLLECFPKLFTSAMPKSEQIF